MIYIACPEKLATGGTELLHQFYFKIKKIDSNVKIFYYNYSGSDSPIAERFLKYDVEYVTELDDKKENFIIFPEVATNKLKKYKKSKKSIWWMSVDNYFNSIGYGKNFLSKIRKNLKRHFRNKYIFSNKKIYHFVQSKYAYEFLKKNNVQNIMYLTDYIGENILNENVEYTSKNRRNRVLYNPKKGFEFTKKIIENMNDFEFIPLENMTQERIIDLCKTSKVYIDFGTHPGKDRFPREASYLGCLVITGLRGSAKYKEDIYIDSKYKIEDKEENIEKIKGLIREIYLNYDILINDFREYIEKIKREEEVFNIEVLKVYEFIKSL